MQPIKSVTLDHHSSLQTTYMHIIDRAFDKFITSKIRPEPNVVAFKQFVHGDFDVGHVAGLVYPEGEESGVG